MAVNRTSTGNLQIFSRPFSSQVTVTTNSHWSIPFLYTDVGGLYPKSPLKLPHAPGTD